MNEKPIFEIPEDLINKLKRISEKMSLSFLKGFNDFYESLPDEVVDTVFYKKICELNKNDLRYEDIQWLFEDYGVIDNNDFLELFLENLDNDIELHQYLKAVVLNNNINKRDKVVLLLSHMEPLIYDVNNSIREPWGSIKKDVSSHIESNKYGLSVEGFSKLFVLGITYIVFANTDNYKESIDKRMPFRNYILHNGIVSYTDEEIEKVYALSINFLSMLVDFKKVNS